LLVAQEAKIKKAIAGLLDLADSRGCSDSIRTRLADRERALADVQAKLCNLTGVAEIQPLISKTAIKKNLSGLDSILQTKSDHDSEAKAVLKALLPKGLSVSCIGNKTELEFNIVGDVAPMAQSHIPFMYLSATGSRTPV
jgi:hypothetical protein